MDDLVRRLSQGNHPVELRLRPEKTITELRSRLKLGYVHVLFTDTRGGTELGVRIDSDASDCRAAELDQPAGSILLVGSLSLNFVPVRLTANVDLATMMGTGRLDPLES